MCNNYIQSVKLPSMCYSYLQCVTITFKMLQLCLTCFFNLTNYLLQTASIFNSCLSLIFCSFSFSSRWHRSARKDPYALRPFSQQSPQSCPRNSASVCVGEHRSFVTLEGGMSAASFLHSSFFHAINALMLWPVHVQKVPQTS